MEWQSQGDAWALLHFSYLTSLPTSGRHNVTVSFSCSRVLFTLRDPPKGRPWLRLPALRGGAHSVQEL